MGAGIGGLCAARAVALAGHEPVVLERAERGTAVGAGLVLWPNAMRALAALERDRAVLSIGAPAERGIFRGADGRKLSELDLGALGRRAGAPVLVAERPALHEALGEGVEIRYGAAVEAVDANGVSLAGGERLAGDAVIGADGIGSVAREFVCPDARPIDTGFTVLRGIAAHEIGAGEASESWGRGELFGAAALPAGRTYWFYEAPTELIGGREGPAAVGLIDAERWPPPAAAVLAATDPKAVLVNPILRLPVLERWTREAVALLGDAAHAMEPNLGQGAAQAIEDAGALLGALRAEPDPRAALAAYEEARRPRARMFQRESSRMARLALSERAGPRDLLMRLVPDALRARAIDRILHRYAPAS